MSGGQWWPYNTDQWREVRDVVRVRDGHECVCCGAWRMLDVHHVQPWRCDGEVFDPRNLVTVCRDCHEAVHAELGRIGYHRLRDMATHWKILVKQVNLIDYDQNLRNPSIVL